METLKPTPIVYQRPNPEEIDSFAFPGGGANGLALASFLKRFADVPGFSFKNVKRAAGSSVGSVAALALCLNLEPDEMFNRLADINFNEIADKGPIWTWPHRVSKGEHTLYQGNVLYQNVLQLLRDKIPDIDPEKVTFRDLKRLGFKDLYVVTTKLYRTNREGQGEKMIWSYETTPDAPVAAIIRASTAAFPYFPEVTLKKHPDGHYEVLDNNTKDPLAEKHVDGGFCDNCPIEIFDYEKYVFNQETKDDTCPSKEMLDYEKRGEPNYRKNEGVRRMYNPHVITACFDAPQETIKKNLSRGLSLFKQKAEAIINAMLNSPKNEKLAKEKNAVRTIPIERRASLVDFGMNKQKQMHVLSGGEESVTQFWNLPPLSEPYIIHNKFTKDMPLETRYEPELARL